MLRRTCQLSTQYIKQTIKKRTNNITSNALKASSTFSFLHRSHRPIHTSQPLRFSHGWTEDGHKLHPIVPPPAHIDTPDNTVDTHFDFSKEEYDEIKQILAKYPSNYKQSATIPMLWIAQKHCGNWIPLAAMNKIAEILELHPMRVYEVATFYTMFNRSKIGRFHLQVCGTTPCMVSGSDEVFRAIKDYAGIEPGQTDKEKWFTCVEVECLACCANAPMIQVNNEEVYEDLNYENTKQLLSDLKEGKAKIGSQIGRNVSEGVLGRTSLINGANTPEPPCRDFDALKKQLEEEARKKAEESKS